MNEHAAHELQLVTFLLGGCTYALDVTRIKEIVRMPPVTRVPRAPRHVSGVTNLRGHVIPVMNLRLRFDMPGREADGDTRVIVVEREGGAVGFLVDAVAEILRLPEDFITPGAALGTASSSEWVAGVGRLGEALVLLLDLDKLLEKGLHEITPEPAPEISGADAPRRPRGRQAA